MPIRIQSELPAKEILENENIFVMDETRAMHQDIRPLKVAILNVMPIKEDTELQLLRVLSNTPLQIDVTFLNVKTHISKNTSASHLNKFYTFYDEIKNESFLSKMLITGRNSARYSSGRRKTLRVPFISAGVRRQAFIIISELRKKNFPKNFRVFTNIA